MKLGIAAAAFCIAALFATARAMASPFCAADVGFMVPWDFGTDAPAAGDTSAHYVYGLKDTGTDVLSGHIVMATDTQTYTLPFSDVHFMDAGNPEGDPDPIGDEFRADDNGFVTLPSPVAIRYAWISDVTDSSGATTRCPVFPYKLQPLSPDERTRMTRPAPPKGVTILYRDKPAAPGSPLAAASCAAPYRDVAPDGDGPRNTLFWDRSIVGKPEVTGAAAVDPTGKVIATAVLQSSGSQVYDDAAKEEWSVRKFIPALFDCQPVAGIYYFRVQYYYQR